MAYVVNTEALTFDDMEEDGNVPHCALCDLAENSSAAMTYMRDLEAALLRANSQSVYTTMCECWERYVRKPLVARQEQCPTVTADEMRHHFVNHTFSATRTMLNDMRRVEKLQEKLPVFVRDEMTQKVVTDKVAAKHYASLLACKLDLMKQLKTTEEPVIPTPPDMVVLMNDA